MKIDKQKLLSLYPEYDSVLGPYYRKDGRQHLILNNSKLSKGIKGKTKTISYPKALVEVRENRLLTREETVDHDDRDFTNDLLSNLIIRTRSVHASLDIKRVVIENVKCILCNKEFIPSKEQRSTRSLNKSGPYCSKQCSGIYGTNIQKGYEVIDRKPINTEYYRVEK